MLIVSEFTLTQQNTLHAKVTILHPFKIYQKIQQMHPLHVASTLGKIDPHVEKQWYKNDKIYLWQIHEIQRQLRSMDKSEYNFHYHDFRNDQKK